LLRKIRKLIPDRIANKHKIKLAHLRERARFAARSLLHPGSVNSTVCHDLAPIFVVGSNRSGASLCTVMLSKHPRIEGIFEGEQTDHLMGQDGHSSNRVGANHLWGILSNPDHDLSQGENILWGLPSFISKIYVESVSNTDRKMLINQLLSLRKTGHVPLIMDSLNILRIPLIKQLFPNAKFVLVTRDHRSYIESCSDKWTKDREIGVFSPTSYIDHPHIGLHWLLINATGLYDLRKYAEGDYIHIKLENLHGDESTRIEAINRVFNFLNLEPMEIEDSSFDQSFAHVLSTDDQTIEVIDRLVCDLIEFERATTGNPSDPSLTGELARTK